MKILKSIFLILFIISFQAQGRTLVTTHNDSGKVEILQSHRNILLTLDEQLYQVEKGSVFTISKTFKDVPTDSSVYFRVKTTTKLIKFEIYVSCENKVYLNTYKGTVYSDTGTTYIPFNRLIGDTTLSTIYCTYNPTITSFGDLRGDDMLGSGSPNRAGGQTNRVFSAMLPNKEFLLRLINAESQAQDINIIINFIEEN